MVADLQVQYFSFPYLNILTNHDLRVCHCVFDDVGQHFSILGPIVGVTYL